MDLISIGNVFHNVAAEVSNKRLPYLTVLFLFGTSDVVNAERRGRDYGAPTVTELLRHDANVNFDTLCRIYAN